MLAQSPTQLKRIALWGIMISRDYDLSIRYRHSLFQGLHLTCHSSSQLPHEHDSGSALSFTATLSKSQGTWSLAADNPCRMMPE